MTSHFQLQDYRRHVFELYQGIREDDAPPEERHRTFIEKRNELFLEHPQSPLSPEQKQTFSGLAYYPYDPSYRLEVVPDVDVDNETFDVALRDDGTFQMKRVARVDIEGAPLSLFWILGYGGGLFLPFRDSTNSGETYGGGRYLLDTIKGSDLGNKGEKLILDFNFAYNPSCAYNSRWHCPLAPAENRLSVALEAGEKAFQ